MKKNLKLGLQLSFLTALISGAANFINKLAVTGIKPLLLTSLKNSLVFLTIFGLILILGKFKQLKKLNKNDWLKLLAIGIIGGSLPFYLFFTGLQNLPAVTASLIHKTLVLWVAILAIPLLKEKFTKIHGLAIALLFGSNLLIGGLTNFSFNAPALMTLAATILWALENILAKIALKNIDPFIVAGARMGFGAIILLAATSLTGQDSQLASLSFKQLSLVLLTTGLLFAYVTSWYSALKHASAITVSSVLVSATLVTNILSAIFITHSFSLTNFYQAALILTGLGLVTFASLNFKNKPALDKS